MADPEAYLKVMDYIEHNPMAALGTVNKDGTPHGAIVYICALRNQTVCFVTKNLTQKYTNLMERPAVSLTIGNDRDSSTLQISGEAYVIQDPSVMETVMRKIHAVHARMADWLPPLAKLRAGNYAIFGVKITKARLGAFQGLDIGSQYIYTEL